MTVADQENQISQLKWKYLLQKTLSFADTEVRGFSWRARRKTFFPVTTIQEPAISATTPLSTGSTNQIKVSKAI
jgi:hypothetical protein